MTNCGGCDNPITGASWYHHRLGVYLHDGCLHDVHGFDVSGHCMTRCGDPSQEATAATRAPALRLADRVVLGAIRDALTALRQSKVIQPHHQGYCAVKRAWIEITEQLFGGTWSLFYRRAAEERQDLSVRDTADLSFENAAGHIADSELTDQQIETHPAPIDAVRAVMTRALEIRAERVVRDPHTD